MANESGASNVVVPEKMSVGELRAWLAQFGEKNRKHYETNLVQKHPESADMDRSMQEMEPQLEQTMSSTSSTASSSRGGESTFHIERNTTDDTFAHIQEDELEQQSIPDRSLLDDDEEGEEARTLPHGDSSVLNSLDMSEQEEETPGPILPWKQDSPQAAREEPELEQHQEQEEYRILSIRKLLEAPKPTVRRYTGGSWDEFLDDELASDPGHHHSTASFVWQRKSAWADLEDTENSSLQTHTNESVSTSSALTGLRKKTQHHQHSDDETDDSLSTKSRSSNRSLRSRLPRLLCKSAKGTAAETKLVQRTYSNGWQPKSENTAFRSPSPHPLYHSAAFLHSRTAANYPPTLHESGERTQRKFHQAEAGSTMSCPEFAAASAYLDQFSKNNNSSSSNESFNHERPHDRSHHREARQSQHRRWSRKEGGGRGYGTSAILPGAVGPSLGQVFAVEDDAVQKGVGSLSDYKATQHSSSQRQQPPSSSENALRVSDAVSKFGGHAARQKSGHSAVQRRQEELERQWARSKGVQHVKKVKWQVCSNSGSYKKKIVVDQEPTE